MSTFFFLLACCSLAASAGKGPKRVLRETFKDDLSSPDHCDADSLIPVRDKSLSEEEFVERANARIKACGHDAIKACREDGIPSECMSIIQEIMFNSLDSATLGNTSSGPTIISKAIPVTLINSIFVFHYDTLKDFLGRLFEGDEHFYAASIVNKLRASSGSAEERVVNAFDFLFSYHTEEKVSTAFEKLFRIIVTLVDEVARRSAWLSTESRLVIKQVNEVLNNPKYTGTELQNKIASLLAPENRGQEVTDLAKSMEIWAYQRDSWLFAPDIKVLY